MAPVGLFGEFTMMARVFGPIAALIPATSGRKVGGSDGTGFRMLVCPGTGIDTGLFVRGTPLNVKFDAGCEAVRREVMENGWEHHYALMYGDRVDELTALCRNMNIEMHLVK